ncbi:hypothetical protein DOY81_013101 [Sarcophaga bullata]|nr:hypothetical protein DOY81_013101 [Sarcophaga bullata]
MGPKKEQVFILGSKGAGKTTVINSFFERDENPKPTLALEYSFGRRSGHLQKQVLNIWELGSMLNSQQLIKVPLRSHGISNFAAVIMLDLAQPQTLWSDLEAAYQGLKDGCQEMITKQIEWDVLMEKAKERVKKDHMDLNTLDLIPFPVVIVGGKYDLFIGYEPENKKHVCRCLRSMAHLMGASFGSPSNPFRMHTVDYNDALSIWFGTDSWSSITPLGPQSLQSIQTSFTNEDTGFRESVIDEMRAQKDEELKMIIKDVQLRSKFQAIET